MSKLSRTTLKLGAILIGFAIGDRLRLRAGRRKTSGRSVTRTKTKQAQAVSKEVYDKITESPGTGGRQGLYAGALKHAEQPLQPGQAHRVRAGQRPQLHRLRLLQHGRHAERDQDLREDGRDPELSSRRWPSRRLYTLAQLYTMEEQLPESARYARSLVHDGDQPGARTVHPEGAESSISSSATRR